MTEHAPHPQGRSPRSRLRSPRFWVLTLATWAMIALTFSLGRWQLGRADHKEQLAQAMAARQALAPLDTPSVLQAEQPDPHRRAILRGHWLAERTVYLDNRPMRGRPGFWVFTPLQLEAGARAILVQRGWIPRDFVDRSRLAPVQTPSGPVEVSGRMALAPGKLYEFEGGERGRIRQNLDIAAYRLETGVDLLGAILIQTGPASEGLQRDWDAPDTGIDKHRGYAFQWFGLCALLVGLYAWFQWLAPALRKQ